MWTNIVDTFEPNFFTISISWLWSFRTLRSLSLLDLLLCLKDDGRDVMKASSSILNTLIYVLDNWRQQILGSSPLSNLLSNLHQSLKFLSSCDQKMSLSTKWDDNHEEHVVIQLHCGPNCNDLRVLSDKYLDGFLCNRQISKNDVQMHVPWAFKSFFSPYFQ